MVRAVVRSIVAVGGMFDRVVVGAVYVESAGRHR